jgi:hypothetical protein
MRYYLIFYSNNVHLLKLIFNFGLNMKEFFNIRTIILATFKDGKSLFSVVCNRYAICIIAQQQQVWTQKSTFNYY